MVIGLGTQDERPRLQDLRLLGSQVLSGISVIFLRSDITDARPREGIRHIEHHGGLFRILSRDIRGHEQRIVICKGVDQGLFRAVRIGRSAGRPGAHDLNACDDITCPAVADNRHIVFRFKVPSAHLVIDIFIAPLNITAGVIMVGTVDRGTIRAVNRLAQKQVSCLGVP